MSAPATRPRWRNAARALQYKYDAYASWGLSGAQQPAFEELARDRFIIGDAIFVKEEIARYREALGVDHS